MTRVSKHLKVDYCNRKRKTERTDSLPRFWADGEGSRTERDQLFCVPTVRWASCMGRKRKSHRRLSNDANVAGGSEALAVNGPHNRLKGIECRSCTSACTNNHASYVVDGFRLDLYKNCDNPTAIPFSFQHDAIKAVLCSSCLLDWKALLQPNVVQQRQTEVEKAIKRLQVRYRERTAEVAAVSFKTSDGIDNVSFLCNASRSNINRKGMWKSRLISKLPRNDRNMFISDMSSSLNIRRDICSK